MINATREANAWAAKVKATASAYTAMGGEDDYGARVESHLRSPEYSAARKECGADPERLDRATLALVAVGAGDCFDGHLLCAALEFAERIRISAGKTIRKDLWHLYRDRRQADERLSTLSGIQVATDSTDRLEVQVKSDQLDRDEVDKGLTYLQETLMRAGSEISRVFSLDEGQDTVLPFNVLNAIVLVQQVRTAWESKWRPLVTRKIDTTTDAIAARTALYNAVLEDGRTRAEIDAVVRANHEKEKAARAKRPPRVRVSPVTTKKMKAA